LSSGGWFDGLWLPQELAGSSISLRAVRTLIVVADSPFFNFASSLSERDGKVRVDALVREPRNKRLDEAPFLGFYNGYQRVATKLPA